jgi:outer membrane lipoprotein-sorting protein
MRNPVIGLLLLAASLTAQNAPPLLKEVHAVYAALPSTTYDIEMVQLSESSTGLRSEQRWRIVGNHGRDRQEALPSGLLYVFDGHSKWAYHADNNEYTKIDGSWQGQNLPPALNMFEAYNLNSGTYLRHETVESTPGPVPCEVYEVTRPESDVAKYSPLTYWIDPVRKLVMKLQYAVEFKSSSRMMFTYSLAKAQVGRPVDDNLFHFTPPDGADHVETLTFGAKSKLPGKPCPEFSLKYADGNVITSAALRGKVIILHFDWNWQSGVTPMMELAYRALRSDGIEIVQVMQKIVPAPKGAPRFTLPVALDPDGSLAKKFGLYNSGTVLIDRLGMIVLADEQDQPTPIARAMQSVGIW